MTETIQIDCHGLTDVGRIRDANEDQFLIAELGKSMLVRQTTLALDHEHQLFGCTQGHLFLVADGIGGYAAGGRASSIATGAVAHYVLNTMPWFFRLDEKHEDDLREELKSAVEQCETMIRADAEGRFDRQGMGTTLTMAYVLWPRLYLVHVGDSRGYLLRKTELRRLTRDHTVAQELMEAGAIDSAEVESSRWSHVLCSAIGGRSSELNPEVYKISLEVGDTVLLCTDGLTRHLADADVASILKEDHSAEGACLDLIEAANRAGGSDNITVVVAKFVGGAPAPPTSAAPAA
ncbi:MAG: protein phosphatase 2C domain-containing protein [Planctomycetes bacterium]|nr:protein phosphatase 2C domain-containing protein [Planctomycetota bacterium]